MATRLWDKGEELDAAVRAFTVGNDPVLDLELLRWDCFGTAAHARMLVDVDLLEAGDLQPVLQCLSQIRELSSEGKFDIPEELEDCHTAIESHLVEQLGDVGKRIHAGRSRNDQVITAMRLYLRHQCVRVLKEVSDWGQVLGARYDELSGLEMPGYTHLQRAMPSSIGMWMHAFVEGCLDLVRDGFGVLAALDSNPLGAGAGFGSNLPLDRERSAAYMGFARVQRSPIDVQNSRGRYELRVLRWGEEIAGLFEKLAWDLQLYVTSEFGFVSLPAELTTGSSIMPQKRNPDVLELLRGRAARIRGAAAELSWVAGKLPSNYHRDTQYTKAPVFRGITDLRQSVAMVRQVSATFKVNSDALSKAMTQELYAAYDANRQVMDGKPFRDAYRETAKRVAEKAIDVSELSKDIEVAKTRTAADMKLAREELAVLAEQIDTEAARLAACEAEVYVLA